MLDNLVLGGTSSLRVTDGTISTGKHLLFAAVDDADWNVNQGRLHMNGTGPQFLEIGGKDLGADGSTFGNFGIGQLTVGTGEQDTVLRLADVLDNGNRSGHSEALYLFGIEGKDGLVIEGGSTFVIADYNVYANLGGVMTALHDFIAPDETTVPFGGGFLALEPPGPALETGDMDLDGDVDFDDIDGFALGLADPVAYLLSHDELATRAGDTDDDGDLDFDDIDGFAIIVAWPASHGAQAIPEPTALVLVAIGLIGLARLRWRRVV